MSNKIIFSDKSSIKITVMNIDGKKLTKSLLNQLPNHFLFDDQFNFTGDKIFGCVYIGAKTKDTIGSYVIVGEVNGKIVKFGDYRLAKVAQLTPNSRLVDFSLYSIKKIIGDDRELYVDYKEERNHYFPVDNNIIKNNLTQEAQNSLFSIVEKVKKMYKEILDHQIFV